MKALKVLFLLLFVVQHTGFSQADSILALPNNHQVLALLKWYGDDLSKRDSQQAVTSMATAEKLFEQGNNQLLQQQAWLLIQLYEAKRIQSAGRSALAMLDAANKAGNNNWPIIQAECWHYAGGFYFAEAAYVTSNYIPAFEYMLKAQNVFDEYDPVKYAYLFHYADGLAGCYYRFGEYREAIKYLKKTLLLPPEWHSYLYFPSIYNTIALCYSQLRQYDSAAIWYRESYQAAAAKKDTFIWRWPMATLALLITTRGNMMKHYH